MMVNPLPEHEGPPRQQAALRFAAPGEDQGLAPLISLVGVGQQVVAP